MIDALPLLLGPEGYQISRSVRLRSSASAFFSRTIGAASTSTTICTWSGWVKRGALGAARATLAYHGNTGATGGFISLEFATDTLRCFFDGSNNIQTTAVYRDPSAWYHVVLAYDSTQATASNRAKLYVNGVQITAFSVSLYPPLNQAINAGSTNVQNLGRVSTHQFDGYLTEINFIDGQALTPASFGETNPVTGVWQPKKYTGTYGTNGFYLNFSDNSAATAAAIGKDNSGNGNNLTPNNISVTSGVTYDSMLDVPTPWADGGNGRGNYCTLNPLVVATLAGGATVSNGNLRVAGSAGVSNAYARGTMALSGKFYAEFFFDVVNATASIGIDVVTATAGALNTSSTAVSYRSGGNKRVLGTETAYGASWVANDIIGVAVDTTANTIEFFKNGVSQGVITSSAFFAQGDCIYAMSKDDVGSPIGYANFGQRPFSYTPPSGFKALNTLNLPTPTILKGNQYFDATLYTGTGASQTIVNAGGFQPDLVWPKIRSIAGNHSLYDAVRGANQRLSSSTTSAEATFSNSLTAFNSNGFSLGANPDGDVNANTATYVAWQWKEGATQGFDIVTYTGNSTNRTVAHNLGVAPSMLIFKPRNAADNWPVWHKSFAVNEYVYLNLTNAKASLSTFMNSTLPDSSNITLGTWANTNANTQTMVCYAFAEVAGFSKAFSYTGNGSADGPFIFCGFRPAFVLIKCSSAGSTNWIIHDTARETYNLATASLYPNLSNAETVASTQAIDILSNGFKARGTSGDINSSGATYIGFALAENPFKNALAR